MKYFLAVDIGASSGRHILAHRDASGELVIEEIHRFITPLVTKEDGSCYWDVRKLYLEVKNGLKKAKELGKIPSKIGIDTFGVDYALLDENDDLIGEVRSYRDPRTIPFVKSFLSPEKVYSLTGIQPHSFDTIYQLADDKASGKLKKAKSLLMLPSYLAYLLTDVKQNELSILSTSALMDSRTFRFSSEILANLGLEESFFPNPIEAGTLIGAFTKEVADEIGYQAEVYAALEHDTASAFYGSYAKKDELLLSSGTWSLIGVILDKAIVSPEAYESGLSNEFSHLNEIRFLMNISGMWMINSLMKEDPDKPNILEVVAKAKAAKGYQGYFDANDKSLQTPGNMRGKIMSLLEEKGYPSPKDFGECYYAVYLSLAHAYKEAVLYLEKMIGRKFEAIRVFGGGSKNTFLNELTERITGLKINLGPAEATAIGNILSIE